MDVKLTFIWHDCFVISLPGATLITDYWIEAPSAEWQDNASPALLDSLPVGLPLYILVSHHHKDHFNRNIFAWAARFPNVRYIISRDTEKSVRYLLRENSTYHGPLRVDADRVTVLTPGDTYTDDVLKIKAFGSTDTGNSYLVECAGRTIFHAGDLNAWIWKDESTEEEVAEAIGAFESIVESIASEHPEIDVAMFPVDSRIGTDWWEGAALFVRMIYVKYFIPMHFCLAVTPDALEQRIAQAVDFDLYRNPVHGSYIALTRPLQEVTLHV